MPDMLWKAYKEGGLVLLLVMALCYISYRIITHILRTNDKTLQMAMDAQDKWQRAIDNATSAIQLFKDEVKTAHGYQREEHQKIVNNQDAITKHLVILNENAQTRGRSLEKICSSLDEQKEILVRVNGFKDDRK